MKRLNHLLCQRTDLLVMFWLFGGGILFFYILIPLTDIIVVQLIIGAMYYVVAIKFNDWREKYCETCDK